MKTVVSISNDTYNAAERLAKRLGTSRSRLYTQALNSYLAKHKTEGITTKLNEVYSDNDSSLDLSLKHLQLKSLPKKTVEPFGN